MKVLLAPKHAPFYMGLWNNKYSACVEDGAIIRYLREIPSDEILAVPYGDGLVEQKDFGTTNLYMGYDKHIILGVLAARPSKTIQNRLLTLPLDDEIFAIGLRKVLERDIPNLNLPWADRKPVAFWRGAYSSDMKLRKKVVPELQGDANIDALFVRTPWGGEKDWEGKKWAEVEHLYDAAIAKDGTGRPIPLTEFVKHKYIIIIDGIVIASSLQWVFGSGSVPILVTHPDNDFWFKEYLVPYVNYVPAQEAADVKNRVRFLVENDELARAIAQNAQALADKIFSPDFQRQHLRKKLQRQVSQHELRYLALANSPSDINEHLPTLRVLANQCQHICELGVRGVVSSWAFLTGLAEQKEPSTLWMNDVQDCNLEEIKAQKPPQVQLQFVLGSDLEVALPKETDMTFIDTFHCYGQLRRELARFAPITRKFLVMHDTTIDAECGECVRGHADVAQLMRETGWDRHDITTGLWPAILEFLERSPEWVLVHRYMNNNGLTVLARQEVSGYAREVLCQHCKCACPCHSKR